MRSWYCNGIGMQLHYQADTLNTDNHSTLSTDSGTCFRCGSQCIPRYQVCDRVIQCSDGSDERGCSCKFSNLILCVGNADYYVCRACVHGAMQPLPQVAFSNCWSYCYLCRYHALHILETKYQWQYLGNNFGHYLSRNRLLLLCVFTGNCSCKELSVLSRPLIKCVTTATHNIQLFAGPATNCELKFRSYHWCTTLHDTSWVRAPECTTTSLFYCPPVPCVHPARWSHLTELQWTHQRTPTSLSWLASKWL